MDILRQFRSLQVRGMELLFRPGQCREGGVYYGLFVHYYLLIVLFLYPGNQKLAFKAMVYYLNWNIENLPRIIYFMQKFIFEKSKIIGSINY